MKHVVLYVGHLYKPFWTNKNWPGWQGGSGKVKIGQNTAQNGPRFWLWSPLEAPKWVQDPGNGLKSIRGNWGDHLGSIWAKTRPLHFQIFQILNATDRPIVHCFCELLTRSLGLDGASTNKSFNLYNLRFLAVKKTIQQQEVTYDRQLSQFLRCLKLKHNTSMTTNQGRGLGR